MLQRIVLVNNTSSSSDI